MSADGTTLSLKRRIEGAEEAVELALPGLVTCEKGLVEPRHPPLPKVMKAKKTPEESVGPVATDTESACGAKFVRLAPPSARPACRFIEGEPAEMARELVRRLRDEVKVL
jgi:electron transfer flavoprotein beta subunit